MFIKAILFPLGCILAWFILLPLLMIGGGLALLAYAVFAELAAIATGKTSKRLDASTAREMARRLCSGYGVTSRAARRQPLP